MRKIYSIVVLVLCIICCNSNVHAAIPRVMLEDYKVSEGEVVSGKDFNLKLTLRNHSVKQVRNIKVSISTENGEFIPVEDAGNAYIESIDAGDSKDVSFKLKACDGLEEKSYKINVVTDYESSSGYEYKSEEMIFLPVSLEQKLMVTDLFVDGGSCVVGDTVEISAAINNTGDGTLYNVMAEIEGDNVVELNSYVGNIEKGKSGNLDLLTKTDVVTEGYHNENKLIVKYDTKAGETITTEMLIDDISVGVPVYENLEKIKEGSDMSSVWSTIGKIIAGIIIAAVIVYALYRRQKRKQRILEEFAK